jgi:hypothetical protein
MEIIMVAIGFLLGINLGCLFWFSRSIRGFYDDLDNVYREIDSLSEDSSFDEFDEIMGMIEHYLGRNKRR